MNLLNRFLERTEFESYEDFYKNYKLKYDEDFNFGFDVVDEYARICPTKKALVWCDDEGREKIINYGELSKYTNKTANYFKSLGIKKGDMVMLILKRHYEFWYSIIAPSVLVLYYKQCNNTLDVSKKLVTVFGKQANTAQILQTTEALLVE